jgi:hypothetical protein
MALRFLNRRPHTLENLLSTVVTRTSLVECWIPETSLSTLRTSELLTLQRENLPANDTRSQGCIVPRPPPPGRAGSLASTRRRFWVLRARIHPSVSILTPHLPVLRSCGSTISAWRPLSSGARCSEWSFTLAPTTSCNPPSASGGAVGVQS